MLRSLQPAIDWSILLLAIAMIVAGLVLVELDKRAKEKARAERDSALRVGQPTGR